MINNYEVSRGSTVRRLLGATTRPTVGSPLTVVVCFFLLCPKRPSPFFLLYTPQEPLYKWSTSCFWRFLSSVQLHQRTVNAIICLTHKPCCAPPQKNSFYKSGKKTFYGCLQFAQFATSAVCHPPINSSSVYPTASKMSPVGCCQTGYYWIQRKQKFCGACQTDADIYYLLIRYTSAPTTSSLVVLSRPRYLPRFRRQHANPCHADSVEMFWHAPPTADNQTICASRHLPNGLWCHCSCPDWIIGLW